MSIPLMVFLSVFPLFTIIWLSLFFSKLNPEEETGEEKKTEKPAEKKGGEIKKQPKTTTKEFKLPFKLDAVAWADIKAVVILAFFPLTGLLCMWIQSHEEMVLKFFGAQ